MSCCDLDLNLDLAEVTFILSCVGYILEPVRCRKLLGRDNHWSLLATSLCDHDFATDLALVTLTFKILSRLYLRNINVQKLILGRDIG